MTPFAEFLLFIVGITVALGMPAMLILSMKRGDSDKILLFAVAISVGVIRDWSLLVAVVLAIIYLVQRDYRKAGFAILGLILGVVAFAVVDICLMMSLFADETDAIGCAMNCLGVMI